MAVAAGVLLRGQDMRARGPRLPPVSGESKSGRLWMRSCLGLRALLSFLITCKSTCLAALQSDSFNYAVVMQLGGESAEHCTSQIPSWRKEWENSRLGGLCPAAPRPVAGCSYSCSGFSSASSHLSPCGPSPPLLWDFGFILPSWLLHLSSRPPAGRAWAGGQLALLSTGRVAPPWRLPRGASSCVPLAYPHTQPGSTEAV